LFIMNEQLELNHINTKNKKTKTKSKRVKW